MWLCTRYGFFSVVCATRPKDKKLLMIRARDESHLKALRQNFPRACLGPIIKTPDTDYPFRCIIPRADWETLMLLLAEDVTYFNFKEETSKHHPKNSAFIQFLHEVWSLWYQHNRK